MSEAVVQVDGLVKRYGERIAVDGLSLTVRPGTVLALLGPNGAGKTSTVEVCEGLRTADAGSVRVLGLDPRDPALRPRVGVMPQSGGTYPGLRAGEVLRLFAAYAAHPLDPALLLERLGLEGVERTACRRLSGGQAQRLSLALAVVARPELVFLDEPSAGLDPQARLATWDLVESLRRDGATVVLTTHLMDEAERLADDVVIVDAGQVVAAGTVHELTRTGAIGQLRWTAKPGLDRRPAAHGPARRVHGQGVAGRAVPRGGLDRPAAARRRHRLVRRARRARRGPAGGAAHPGGRLPRAHRPRAPAMRWT